VALLWYGYGSRTFVLNPFCQGVVEGHNVEGAVNGAWYGVLNQNPSRAMVLPCPHRSTRQSRHVNRRKQAYMPKFQVSAVTALQPTSSMRV